MKKNLIRAGVPVNVEVSLLALFTSYPKQFATVSDPPPPPKPPPPPLSKVGIIHEKGKISSLFCFPLRNAVKFYEDIEIQ